MAFVRHLEVAKFRCFDRYSPWKLKYVFAYQILSKSDNSRLRYWDKAVFKMAAVYHPEFAKIAVLVTWPISACDSSSFFQISVAPEPLGTRRHVPLHFGEWLRMSDTERHRLKQVTHQWNTSWVWSWCHQPRLNVDYLDHESAESDLRLSNRDWTACWYCTVTRT